VEENAGAKAFVEVCKKEVLAALAFVKTGIELEEAAVQDDKLGLIGSKYRYDEALPQLKAVIKALGGGGGEEETPADAAAEGEPAMMEGGDDDLKGFPKTVLK